MQKTVIKPNLAKPVRTAVSACRYGSEGRLIAAGLNDGSIQLWSVTGELQLCGRGLVSRPWRKVFPLAVSMGLPTRASTAEVGFFAVSAKLGQRSLLLLVLRWSFTRQPLACALSCLPHCAASKAAGCTKAGRREPRLSADTFNLSVSFNKGRPPSPCDAVISLSAKLSTLCCEDHLACPHPQASLAPLPPWVRCFRPRSRWWRSRAGTTSAGPTTSCARRIGRGRRSPASPSPGWVTLTAALAPSAIDPRWWPASWPRFIRVCHMQRSTA